MPYFLVLCYSIAKLGQGSENIILIPLTVVKLKYLKKALRVPYSTPNVVVCLEMGLVSIEYVIEIRRFIYLHHILMSISDEPVKKPILSAVRVSIRRKLGK